ncbi:MAG: imidazole glycerol phosphate synthase subunit HisH [Betaproteobacteria bacterium]|nr:imidazole glycerol phosphate synthase subunit HisH [Betaproteobacteria bacterium]
MTTIAVIDYGMGNLRSVSKALEHVAPAANIIVTSDPKVVGAADRIVFPGQGAMFDCMREMDRFGLRAALHEAAGRKPFLGLCIGLQMLFDRSEEGNIAGLGILAGTVRRFPDAAMHGPDGSRLKVPHMGWNQVAQAKPHPLWQGIKDGERFYYVHSYYADPIDRHCVAGETEHGVPFTAAVARDNIFAVQFHPEKSQAHGLRLLANFVAWNP